VKLIIMKRKINIAHVPIILAPLVLFSPVIIAGKALVWGTISTQFIPWWDFAWETLLQGQIPLWNPWVGMGAPLVANYQSAIFYPPYWFLLSIYAIAGIKWMSWGVAIIVAFHLIWSGLGVAKLLEELELGQLPQVVGGLAFSLSGYLVARASFLSINAAAAWLPWILLYSLRMIKGEKRAFWALSVVMAFQLLAGHAQTTWYSILLGGIWVLFLVVTGARVKNWVNNAWLSISRYVLAGLLGAGISAIQLIPTAEYLLQSQRSGEYGFAEAMTYSFWPWRFLTLIVPNLFGNPAAGNYWGYGNFWEDAVYIGLLPFLIAMGVAVRAFLVKTKSDAMNANRSLIIFLSGIVLASFLMALGDNTFIFPLLYKYVPTFGSFQAPTRFTLWAELSLAVLAGIGVSQLEQVEGRRKYWIRLAAAGCVAVIGGAFIGWKFLSHVKTTFFIPIGLAGLFGFGTALLILFQPDRDEEIKFKYWSGLLALLVAVDLIIAGWGLNPGVGIDFYDVAKINENGTRVFITADLEYDLKFNKYFKFESFDPEISWNEMHQDLLPNIPMLSRIEMVNNFDPMVPGRYQTWLDKFNELEIGTQNLMTDLMNIDEIIFASKGVYQNLDLGGVNREAWISDLVEISRSDDKTLDRILVQGSGQTNGVVISFSKSAFESECQSKGSGEAQVYDKSPGHISIGTDLEKSSWLFWSQTWYPGWEAVVDGVQIIEVERANYLFQAVCMPAGEHTVEITYQPRSFIAGGVITVISLFILIAGWIVGNRNINTETHR